MLVASSIVAIFMAILAFIIRMKAANKPTSRRKIILPPLFMSTGFLMFIMPQFHIPIIEAVEAFLLGCVFSIILIKTSKFEVRDSNIFLKRSKLFLFILIGLLIVRLLLKSIVGQLITFEETSSLFFILAFGMILPWRLAMLISYRKLAASITYDEKAV